MEVLVYSKGSDVSAAVVRRKDNIVLPVTSKITTFGLLLVPVYLFVAYSRRTGRVILSKKVAARRSGGGLAARGSAVAATLSGGIAFRSVWIYRRPV